MLGFPVLHYLPEFAQLMSIKSIIPSNYLILCHHLLLPSIFPSIRVFSNESTLPIRLPNYRSFSFSISPSNEYSGLVSCPCCARDSQESSPHHILKTSILSCSAFFMVRLSHLHMTTGKSTALTRRTFVRSGSSAF